ncbi:MAG: VWA domain-containing protein [Gammaproteobacteria bacterium]|nr:VWA domain-containing protein [Gammaproteobacteria bacterium]
MTSQTAAVLEPVNNEAKIALESVTIEATLRGLLFETTVTHTYRNLETENIEAVYTFPLPIDGVLLEMTLEMDGETFTGVVQPKAVATEGYEASITEGDTALLLEQVSTGLYTINVGNLLPGETAIVRFRYAILHHWQGETLRLYLPTTIAPRYGDAENSGLLPHQIPESCLNADYGFRLQITIEGELAQADFEVPTHPVAVKDESGSRILTLSGGTALMDRDFILTLQEPESLKVDGMLLTARDGEEQLWLASFHPRLGDHRSHKIPRNLKLVVDCSGSMSGDSIEQAKKALHEILALLQPADRFNIIAFGSHFEMLFKQSQHANDNSIQQAAQYLRKMMANMGGTEMGAALQAAYGSGSQHQESADLLLITDGEVWGHETLVAGARSSGHRHFTIGVGSAVSESLIRELARNTGGAAEMVTPREDMAERIVRHFQRIDQPRADRVTVIWPTPPKNQFPAAISHLYNGDTLHVWGWFKQPVLGEIRLQAQMDGEEVTISTLTLAPTAETFTTPELPRIAAYGRLTTLPSGEKTALAVQYQLISEETSCLLQRVRAAGEQAEEMPALRMVPHTLAAGWGGGGAVMCSADVGYSSGSGDVYFDMGFGDDDHDPAETPAFLRRTPKPTEDGSDYLETFIEALNAHFEDAHATRFDLDTLDSLVRLGLDIDISQRLARKFLKGMQLDERTLVIYLLNALAESDYGDQMSRQVKRQVARVAKGITLNESTKQMMMEKMRFCRKL